LTRDVPFSILPGTVKSGKQSREKKRTAQTLLRLKLRLLEPPHSILFSIFTLSLNFGFSQKIHFTTSSGSATLFPFYNPLRVEHYQLTPFTRTEATAYISAPIAIPETFPVVREEQPIRERVVPTLNLDDLSLKDVKPTMESPLPPVPIPHVVQHHHEIRYYPFDPSYCLRPQPIALPDLPNEIGKSSILALPLHHLTGKTKALFAPFEFVGVPKFAEASDGCC
jgi:hypothetical protein